MQSDTLTFTTWKNFLYIIVVKAIDDLRRSEEFQYGCFPPPRGAETDKEVSRTKTEVISVQVL